MIGVFGVADLREQQQVLDHPDRAGCAPRSIAASDPCTRIAESGHALEDLEVAGDRRERVLQLVGHGGDQLALVGVERLQLLDQLVLALEGAGVEDRAAEVVPDVERGGGLVVGPVGPARRRGSARGCRGTRGRRPSGANSSELMPIVPRKARICSPSLLGDRGAERAVRARRPRPSGALQARRAATSAIADQSSGRVISTAVGWSRSRRSRGRPRRRSGSTCRGPGSPRPAPRGCRRGSRSRLSWALAVRTIRRAASARPHLLGQRLPLEGGDHGAAGLLGVLLEDPALRHVGSLAVRRAGRWRGCRAARRRRRAAARSAGRAGARRRGRRSGRSRGPSPSLAGRRVEALVGDEAAAGPSRRPCRSPS